MIDRSKVQDARYVPYVDLSREHIALKKDLLGAIERVLASGQFVLGDETEKFEIEFAAYCGVKHAIAVGNGTDAIFLTLKCLGIGDGDEVITVSNSFIATASSIMMTGAVPRFIDVADDFNMDPNLIEAAVNSRTKAILPVHLTGKPAALKRILPIAKKHGLAVIEDAAQSVGARIGEHHVGSFGTAGCFSFHPLKNLSACGDGGVVTTNDSRLHEELKRIRNHGLTNRDHCAGIGYNSRLDEMQAAILNVKMKYTDAYNQRRRYIASRYSDMLSGYVGTPDENHDEYAVYHTFMVKSTERDSLKEHLHNLGIGSAIHYPVPIHLQPAFRLSTDAPLHLPKTESLATRILSLPVFPELSAEEIDSVINAVRTFRSPTKCLQ